MFIASMSEITMKKATCFCGTCSVSIENDPMLHVLCYCSNCRKNFNAVFSGFAFADTEVSFDGELKTFTYEGGSGESVHINMCNKCGTKLSLKPELFSPMIYVTAPLVAEHFEFKPKAEIFTYNKPDWFTSPGTVEQSYETNGTRERLEMLLENLDQRA